MLEQMVFLLSGMLKDPQAREQAAANIAATLIENGVAELAVLMDDGTVHEFKSPQLIAGGVIAVLAAVAADKTSI